MQTLPFALSALMLVAPPTAHPSGGATLSSLDDAQIAHIAVTANQLDITGAQQALERSTNAEVRRFAETMVRDHQGVIEKAVALATRLGVVPEDNETSRSLSADAASTRARLSELSGAAFDKAYMSNEVAYHGAVISAIEDVLVPNTQNAELKQLLVAVLPALRAHKEHAERLVASLNAR